MAPRNAMSKLLILEDDEKLGFQICQHLGALGFETRWLREGVFLSADDLLGVEMMILDLMLPGVYGLDVLQHLRSFSDVPVMVLSARDETGDKVRALQLGADDYMTKPFWPEELVERVRARLRRPLMQRLDGLVVGDLRIDRAKRELYIGDEAIALTRVEFDLLLALAERPGASITRQYLAQRVLASNREGDERTLDVHVSRIRKKIGAFRIKTVWGIGYRLVVDEA